MSKANISLVGIVALDVSWNPHGETKMRFGGIVHAARCFRALGVEFDVYYLAPEYLVQDAEISLRDCNPSSITRIGTVTNGPAVMLIGSPKETANQKYEYLMRDRICSILFQDPIRQMIDDVNGDCLVMTGEYDYTSIIKELSQAQRVRIHIDIANVEGVEVGVPVDTIITSTSSQTFLNRFSSQPNNLKDLITNGSARQIILKENRGGSRYSDGRDWLHTGAQLRSIQHSVGVGDCYNAVYVAYNAQRSAREVLDLASNVAAEYAATTSPESFLLQVGELLSEPVQDLPAGTICPWEERPQFHIYLAAPDFDYLNTEIIDEVCESLEYHNFSVHRPIKENGQAEHAMTQTALHEMFRKDLELIDRCQCMVAVLVPPDPGTLVEIGRAAEKAMTVIGYSPGKMLDNLMLRQSLNEIAFNADDMICAVFRAMDRWRRRV